MKNTRLLITLAAAMCSASAYAGLSQPAEVIVDMDGQIAYGDMHTARNSDNEFAFIGCGIRKYSVSPTEVYSYGFCQASVGETDDTAITCFTENAELLSAIDAMSDYSFITFGWDEELQCTRIGNSTQSFYLPKLKEKK